MNVLHIKLQRVTQSSVDSNSTVSLTQLTRRNPNANIIHPYMPLRDFLTSDKQFKKSTKQRMKPNNPYLTHKSSNEQPPHQQQRPYTNNTTVSQISETINTSMNLGIPISKLQNPKTKKQTIK